MTAFHWRAGQASFLYIYTHTFSYMYLLFLVVFCVDDGCSSQRFVTRKLLKNKQRIRYKLNKLVLETDFIPLSIALLLTLGVSFIALHIGLNVVSLESLSGMGLFSSLVSWRTPYNPVKEQFNKEAHLFKGHTYEF